VDDERDRLIRQIGDIQGGIQRTFARDAARSPLFSSNLTMRQLQVVMLLSVVESASGQDLAHHLGVGLATVTGMVDRLVSQKLVTRREDPSDRRIRRVELTDAGRRLVDDINDTGLAHYRRVLELLDTDTLRDLHEITRKIHDAVTRLDHGTSPPAAHHPAALPPVRPRP
jgi:DNA-binding MarR family transcriptional regulator